jgi:hypothetical protein
MSGKTSTRARRASSRRAAAPSASDSGPTSYLRAKLQVGSCRGPTDFARSERVFHASDMPYPARKARDEVKGSISSPKGSGLGLGSGPGPGQDHSWDIRCSSGADCAGRDLPSWTQNPKDRLTHSIRILRREQKCVETKNHQQKSRKYQRRKRRAATRMQRTRRLESTWNPTSSNGADPAGRKLPSWSKSAPILPPCDLNQSWKASTTSYLRSADYFASGANSPQSPQSGKVLGRTATSTGPVRRVSTATRKAGTKSYAYLQAAQRNIRKLEYAPLLFATTIKEPARHCNHIASHADNIRAEKKPKHCCKEYDAKEYEHTGTWNAATHSWSCCLREERCARGCCLRNQSDWQL